MNFPIPFIFVSSQGAEIRSLELHTERTDTWGSNLGISFSRNSLDVYTVTRLSPSDHLITLSDGSKWEISPSQIDMIKNNWSSNHPVVISPSSQNQYSIENQVLHHHINAKLHCGPDHHFSPSQHVLDIDFLNQTLRLEDAQHNQSGWIIDPSDYPLFMSWHRGHDVIIGKNPGLSRFNKILINTQLKHHIRASQQL
jgi:hypothetical protein